MKIHNPPMTFKSPELQKDWETGLANNQDGYGLAVYRYASEWATRMENLLKIYQAKGGKSIEEFLKSKAKKISHDADDVGITGFMYGAAVSVLSHCWIHGEELRRWHNRKTQIGTEGDEANEKGGVLNPAVINIG